MTYEEILVPLDGSQLSEYILPQVQSVTSAYGSRATLLHVIDAFDSDEKLTPSQKNARADVAAYLESVSENLRRKNVDNQWQVSYGDPATEIVRHAAQHGSDLVMMSTRGESGSREDGMGSVSMAVVSATTIPVMVVRPPKEVADR